MATIRQRTIDKVNAKRDARTTTPKATTSASSLSQLQNSIKPTPSSKIMAFSNANTNLGSPSVSNNKQTSGGSNMTPKDISGVMNVMNNDATITTLPGDVSVAKPKVLPSDGSLNIVKNLSNGTSTGTPDTGGGVMDFLNPENLQKLQTLYPQMYKQDDGFQFDAQNNEGLKAMQKVVENRVVQDMVKRGRLYSSFTDTQMQQKSQELIPAFRQQAFEEYKYGQGQERNRYLDEFSRMQSVLGLSKGIQDETYQRGQDRASSIAKAEQTEYDRYQDLIENQRKDEKAFLDNALTKAQIGEKLTDTEQKIFDLEKSKFDSQMAGATFNEQNKKYLDSYNAIMNNPDSQEYMAIDEVTKNMNGYDIASLMQQANESGNETLADALGYLRYQKIISDPDLIEKYAGEYGVKTDMYKDALDIKQTELENVKKGLDNYMRQIEAEYAKPLAELGLDKAISDLNKGKYEEYIKGVQASYIEAEKKNDLIKAGMEIQNIQSQINDRSARLSLAYRSDARAETKAKAQDKINLDEYNLNKIQSNTLNELMADFTLEEGKSKQKKISQFMDTANEFGLEDWQVIAIGNDYGINTSDMQKELQNMQQQRSSEETKITEQKYGKKSNITQPIKLRTGE